MYSVTCVNSVTWHPTAFKIHVYADHTTVFHQIDSRMDREELQRSAKTRKIGNRLAAKFNICKSKIINFRTKNEKTQCLEGNKKTALVKMSPEKDLGSGLKLYDRVAKAVSKAIQILGLIRRKYIYMDGQLMKQYYTFMSRLHFRILECDMASITEYFRKDMDIIEAVQHRATIIITDFAKMNLNHEQRLQKLDLHTMKHIRMRGLQLMRTYTRSMIPTAATWGHSFKSLARECLWITNCQLVELDAGKWCGYIRKCELLQRSTGQV